MAEYRIDTFRDNGHRFVRRPDGEGVACLDCSGWESLVIRELNRLADLIAELEARPATERTVGMATILDTDTLDALRAQLADMRRKRNKWRRCMRGAVAALEEAIDLYAPIIGDNIATGRVLQAKDTLRILDPDNSRLAQAPVAVAVQAERTIPRPIA